MCGVTCSNGCNTCRNIITDSSDTNRRTNERHCSVGHCRTNYNVIATTTKTSTKVNNISRCKRNTSRIRCCSDSKCIIQFAVRVRTNTCNLNNFTNAIVDISDCYHTNNVSCSCGDTDNFQGITDTVCTTTIDDCDSSDTTNCVNSDVSKCSTT